MLEHLDFFRYQSPPAVTEASGFDFIVGNPPFGGTFDPLLEDDLDRQFGYRGGHKIKKETYAFFIVKSLDMLKPGGRLRFICSDTFLTINTMQGLRRLLMETGQVKVSSLSSFSEETNWGMVVLDVQTGPASDSIQINGTTLDRATIERTANFSWQIDAECAPYFSGKTLGDVLVGTSGMTVGRNEWFVRDLDPQGTLLEPYDFEFFDDPITLSGERERARLGKLSAKAVEAAREAERVGLTRRSVRVTTKAGPSLITLPHPDYCYYNKATGRRSFYAPPSTAIYWRNEGEAVKTFKRAGRWYLHGIGGQPFFKRQGLTWPLIADRIKARYLPSGYILDSGAPCAFLRPGVEDDEIYFLIGWLNTDRCSQILKRVINHTPNIQGKDVERLPYPIWIDAERRFAVVALVKRLIDEARVEGSLPPEAADLEQLERYFMLPAASGASIKE